MDFLRPLLAACAVLLAVSTPVRADRAPTATDQPHVYTAILANVSAIAPKQTFWIGVQLTLQPGWHVYWTNPGDAGLPTQVKFDLPKGFVVGDLQYPTPIRIEQPGNIVMYGYEGSVMLMAQVTAPDDVPASTDISAKVSWLVCADDCIPGKTEVSMTLPKASAAQGAENNADLFKDWLAQVPVSDTSEHHITATIVVPGREENSDVINGDIEVAWKNAAPAADTIQFLPGALDGYTITGTRVTSTGTTTTVIFIIVPMAGQSPKAATFPVVIGYQTPEGHRGITVQISLPKPG